MNVLIGNWERLTPLPTSFWTPHLILLSPSWFSPAKKNAKTQFPFTDLKICRKAPPALSFLSEDGLSFSSLSWKWRFSLTITSSFLSYTARSTPFCTYSSGGAMTVAIYCFRRSSAITIMVSFGEADNQISAAGGFHLFFFQVLRIAVTALSCF